MPDVVTGQLVKEETPPSGWKHRRRLMFLVVAFCMGCICWALWKDTDTAVMQAAVTSSFMTISAVLGSYVFGAVWEDTR